MKHFTLHIRMTKKCNADCSYCSSWQENPITYMKVPDFKKSIDFIIETLIPLYGYKSGENNSASLQYIGGEIAIVPKHILYECVLYARQRFSEVFSHVQDGVQSNLIGSERKISPLATIFGDRIGTSVDHFTNSRTVAGSTEKYREIFNKNLAYLKDFRKVVPGRVFVMDYAGLPYSLEEARIAHEQKYNLTLRPVFAGGKEVGAASPDDISKTMYNLFQEWFIKWDISIQPFHHLLSARLYTLTQSPDLAFFVGCPFQRDCAQVSLDLEPNGDLFVCQDMADSNQIPLGNALSYSFDNENWKRMVARKEHIDEHCRVCTWQKECQGGCMSESLHSGKGLYGRTELCSVWKTIFSCIDSGIEHYGQDNVVKWVKDLGSKERLRSVS